jgi:glucokinase
MDAERRSGMLARSMPEIHQAAALCAIGIDIGGTKMALALIDDGGAILDRAVLSTEAEQGFDRAVERLSRGMAGLMAKAGQRRLAAVGIGCAGPVDSRRGLINNPYTLTGWDRCDIVSPLSGTFGVPVYLENDADAAAAGEYLGGAGRGFDPVVMLTFGTGIGGAAVAGGQIYRGVHGEHPELGHIPVGVGGAACYCGIAGCLESVASGTAIGAAGRAAGFEDARAVFTAAAAGNSPARGIIQGAASAAATAAWTICHTFVPQRIVLGGGIMEEHFEVFAAAIRQRLDPATQFTRNAVSIAQAVLGNDAGMLGAGSLALLRAQGVDLRAPRS